jgi:DNA-directed RNA polymerase subunit M/transcription elongation factor TFIIS
MGDDSSEEQCSPLEERREQGQRELIECLGKTLGKRVERATLQYAEEYCTGRGFPVEQVYSIYCDKVADLIYNFSLDNEDISLHRKNLAAKKLDYRKLPYLSPQELQPTIWAKPIARMILTEEKRNDSPAMTLKPCKICKCDRHHCYQIQLRSADEAMTQFQKCAECGNVVRISD